MSVETEYQHVVLDEKGLPTIKGTSMKVIELVVERLAYGWSPEELHFQHPYLTLGQIYSALAYYWDHSEELDREISKRLKRVDELQRKAKRGPSRLSRGSRPKGCSKCRLLSTWMPTFLERSPLDSECETSMCSQLKRMVQAHCPILSCWIGQPN
jgi:uncharacterized protein (DUF433 family)